MTRTVSIIALAALTTLVAAAGAVAHTKDAVHGAPAAAVDAAPTPDLHDTTSVARARDVSRSRLVVPTSAPAATPAPQAAPPAAPATEPPAPVAVARPVISYGSVADARAYAAGVLGSAQYSCLDAVFQRESGWNPVAMNPFSGAYGIPQALPGSKMAAFGADWAYNPVTQVKWGIAYMDASYGSPCGAWSFWTSHHYY